MIVDFSKCRDSTLFPGLVYPIFMSLIDFMFVFSPELEVSHTQNSL